MKKRICFVVSRLMHLGPIIVLEDIVRGMNQADWEVWIVSLRPEDKHWTIRDRFVTMGCRCVSLGFSMWDLELRTATVARQLDQLIKREEIEIIHSHGYHPDLVSALLPADFRTINTLHNVCEEDYVYAKGWLVGHYMTHRYLRSLRRLTRLVAISHHVEHYYHNKLGTHKRLACIYNGIDTGRFYPRGSIEKAKERAHLGIPAEAIVFIYSGSLSKGKDPLLLINSFVQLLKSKELPASALLIVLGGGPLMEECAALVPEELVANVLFAGFCPNVVPYLAAADIALTASHSEGFGLSVVEAVAMGLPIVASDIPSHREILGKYPEMKGLLFGVGDLQAVMRSMQQAYEQRLNWDMEEISADIHKRFSARLMSQNYQAIYTEETNPI